MNLLTSLRALPLLVVALAAAGCHVHPGPAYAEPVVVRTAYEPVYYRSHVVYFDDYGSPYYRDGGRVVFVGRSDPHYHGYRDHYARNRVEYRTWASHDHHPSARTPARPSSRPSARPGSRPGRPRHTHR